MKSCIFFLIVCLFSNDNILAQMETPSTGTIKGVVANEQTQGELPGASVVIKGSLRGVITNKDGTFSIKIPPGTYSLVISFSGYDRKYINNLVIAGNNIQMLVQYG